LRLGEDEAEAGPVSGSRSEVIPERWEIGRQRPEGGRVGPWIWSVTLLLLLGGILLTGLLLRSTPRGDRDWAPEHAVAPEIRVEGDRVTVEGVRNFRWTGRASAEPRWETRQVYLSDLVGVWYGVGPFTPVWRGPAHTFLSFEFAKGTFLVVSIEARREVGEPYSFIRGTLRRFELLYVFGDERDLIAHRAIHRADQIHLHRLLLSPEQGRALLLDVAAGAESVRTQPTFYHTVQDNCSTRILAHLNAVLTTPLPRSCQILLPGYSDALLYRRGLLDTSLPLSVKRAQGLVNERAVRWQDAPDFSLRIRADPAHDTP